MSQVICPSRWESVGGDTSGANVSYQTTANNKMAASSSSNEQFPSELAERINDFHNALESVENVIRPGVTIPASDVHAKLEPIDRAKFDFTSVYALNSLFWMYLITKGVDLKDHEVRRELSRIQSYMGRIKEVADREKRPRLDAGAAKRFVKGSLYTPPTSTMDNTANKPSEVVID